MLVSHQEAEVYPGVKTYIGFLRRLQHLLAVVGEKPHICEKETSSLTVW